MKKFLSVILSVTMFFGLLAAAGINASAGFTVNLDVYADNSLWLGNFYVDSETTLGEIWDLVDFSGFEADYPGLEIDPGVIIIYESGYPAPSYYNENVYDLTLGDVVLAPNNVVVFTTYAPAPIEISVVSEDGTELMSDIYNPKATKFTDIIDAVALARPELAPLTFGSIYVFDAGDYPGGSYIWVQYFDYTARLANFGIDYDAVIVLDGLTVPEGGEEEENAPETFIDMLIRFLEALAGFIKELLAAIAAFDVKTGFFAAGA
ncbi:MAG: hypothetical protein FWF08_05270 [Oscillospiraceae bacterium]|nr:hypothetical protein [Oscillospiraceae bacterium]